MKKSNLSDHRLPPPVATAAAALAAAAAAAAGGGKGAVSLCSMEENVNWFLCVAGC